MRFFIRIMPFDFIVLLARSLSKLGYWCSTEKRKNVLRNLSIVYPDTDVEPMAREVFASFGQYFVEFFSPVEVRERLFQNTRFEGFDELLTAYHKGKGIVSITAHVGNWELGAFVTAKRGIRVNGVFFTHPNAGLNDIFMQQRKVENLEVISWKADATRKCLESLKKGSLLAIAADIDYTATGIEVELFGHKTKIPRGPLVLSRRTGAPIIPARYLRTRGGGIVTFENIIDPDGLSEGEMARKIARALEKIIRDAGSQWICFEKIWEDEKKDTNTHGA
jgi:lauroyl/myristoyl acyltransferase